MPRVQICLIYFHGLQRPLRFSRRYDQFTKSRILCYTMKYKVYHFKPRLIIDMSSQLNVVIVKCLFWPWRTDNHFSVKCQQIQIKVNTISYLEAQYSQREQSVQRIGSQKYQLERSIIISKLRFTTSTSISWSALGLAINCFQITEKKSFKIEKKLRYKKTHTTRYDFKTLSHIFCFCTSLMSIWQPKKRHSPTNPF